MAQITWRNVEAPDFRSSMEGYRLFSDQLNKAFGAAQNTLADVQKVREDGTSNAVFSELAKYQNDPNALTADLASGAFQSRFAPGSLTPEIMKTVMSKPAELLKYAGEKSAFDQGQLEIKDSNYLRDNRDIFNGYLMAARSQDPAAVSEYEAKYGDILKGASSSALKSFIQNGQDITQGDLSNRGTRLSQLITGTNFNNSQDDRTVDLKADELKGALTQFLPEDRLKYVNNNRDSLTVTYGARAVNRILGALDSSFSAAGVGGSGGAGGSGTSSFDGSFDSAIGGLLQREGGYGIDNNGAAVNFGINAASHPNEDVKGMTKERATQIYKTQYWDPIEKAGVPPEAREAVFDFGVNAGVDTSLAKWKQAGGDINKFNELRMAHYQGLPDWNNPNIRKAWTDRVAATSGIANPRAMQVATDTVTTANIAQDPQTALIRDFYKASQSQDNAEQLAAQLVGKGGTLEGEDRGNASGLITRVADRYHLSAPEAAAVIARSTNGRDSWIRKPFSKLFGDGLDTYIDSDKVEQYAKLFKDRGALAKKAVSLDEQVTTIAKNAEVNNNVKAIQDRITAKVNAALARGVKADLSVEMAQLAAATGTQTGQLLKSAETATRGTPDREKPAAATPKTAPPPKVTPAKANPNFNFLAGDPAVNAARVEAERAAANAKALAEKARKVAQQKAAQNFVNSQNKVKEDERKRFAKMLAAGGGAFAAK